MDPVTELNIDWSHYPNFSAKELACRHCSGYAFHPGFLDELQKLRIVLDLPMRITSGARCAEYNRGIDGHPKSLHIFDKPQHEGQLGTLAVDVATPAGHYRGELFSCAWEMGWSIGWNAKHKFLHLDRRDLVFLPRTTFDY